MIQQKAKGVFAELTPYEIRLARTDRYAYPITVEELLQVPRSVDPKTNEQIEAFCKNRKSPFVQAKCSAFPPGRFLNRHVLDSPNKARSDDYFKNLLAKEYNIKAEEQTFQALYPHNGCVFRAQELLSKELLLVGCSRKGILSEQTQLIEQGIYPRSLELQSLPLMAGIRSALTLNVGSKSVFTVEFGETSTLSYIVGKQGLLFSHDFGFGSQDLVQTVQNELRLQDELSARKLLLSGTFDLRDFGGKLLSKLIRQVRASTGQFEVQTGKSIEYLYAPTLSKSLGWISEILADELGMEEWTPPLVDWMELCGVHLAQGMDLGKDASHWFPLFCLMADYSKETNS